MSSSPKKSATDDILTRFRPHVRRWFTDVFATPTPVQQAAWSAISAGENALVVAPTGSGKTLAAFLWSINRLADAATQLQLPVANTTQFGKDLPSHNLREQSTRGVSVLYISPLKALGVDVERNLRAPLIGIERMAEELGIAMPNIRVGVRSGDTTAAERAAQLRNPPDILITTPESAYLLLTSRARGILANVHTVIIDEIHALAGSKRGVHLAITLERLEHLVATHQQREQASHADTQQTTIDISDPAKPTVDASISNARHEQATSTHAAVRTQYVQRIGLSATVRPLETVAQFLGGAHPVEIIAPEAKKQWDISVVSPVASMSDLPGVELGSPIGGATLSDPLGLATPLPDADAEQSTLAKSSGSIWPHIEATVYQEIMQHRSTLIFVNSRRSAERLAAKLNERHALMLADAAAVEHDADTSGEPLAGETNTVYAPHATLRIAAHDVLPATETTIARAHHGSVSKDERKDIETTLKAGQLRAVVATSSLELGIDMGAIDAVIQVEAPPSVAAGLQRIGRAGHSVGATSYGLCIPKHRSDIIQTTVTAQRMLTGEIEQIQVPQQALDVLVQHTIAAVAMEDWNVDHWYSVVTQAYPYRHLSREVFDAVIDLASGVYPSTDFHELRPRIVHDHLTGMLSARPGAQRLAVTSGGTIPDRGLFGVYLLGGAAGARRVGELDEEMVYESRVGDVFTLGASAWRIEAIEKDRVLVTAAPGQQSRLPFWLGDQIGRPAELGAAIGAFRRHLLTDPATALKSDVHINAFARDAMVEFVQDQQLATGIVPDERQFLLERFRDEVGDWQVVLHSPYGKGVHAPWALAINAVIQRTWGIDAKAVSHDDGIVLRLPDTDRIPDASLFMIPSEEIELLVAEHVGNSALFASRFRECAARALLLPKYNPGKRSPLWQQRQKAAQLLEVARRYPKFPIILEAMRECLHDVYDLSTLQTVIENLHARQISIIEVETTQPSPFAAAILFDYAGGFIYQEDQPLAERKAAALAVDPRLFAQLLGTLDLRELLDPEIISDVHAQLQHTDERRQAKTAEQFVDIVRTIGPIPLTAIPARTIDDLGIAQLRPLMPVQLMQVRIRGVEHIALSQDAALLRDGLGIPVPPNVAATDDCITDALHQLLLRWVRTRGPFVLRDVQEAWGIAASVAYQILEDFVSQRVLVKGRYQQDCVEEEYLALDVLQRIRSKSLYQLRQRTAPVSQSAYARFLVQWGNCAAIGEQPTLCGIDGVYQVIEQLAGIRIPASAWEQWIFATRVANYQPSDLDELLAHGEVIAIGAGQAGSADPWVMLVPAEDLPIVAHNQHIEPFSPTAQQILAAFGDTGFYLFSQIARILATNPLGVREVAALGSAGEAEAVAGEMVASTNVSEAATGRAAQPHAPGTGHHSAPGTAPHNAPSTGRHSSDAYERAAYQRARQSVSEVPPMAAPADQLSTTQIRDGLWELFDAGQITLDSFAPLRARLASGKTTAHKANRTPARTRMRRGRSYRLSHSTQVAVPVDMVGRFSKLPTPHEQDQQDLLAQGEIWLDRHAVVTRGGVGIESVTGGFAQVYKVLSQFEEAGKALRGQFIAQLGAAQFATPVVIDRLRALDDSDDLAGWPSGAPNPQAYVLAAVDPAQPYGAALPWPAAGLSRSAGAVCVLIDGLLVAYLYRGGKTLWVADPPAGVDGYYAMIVQALVASSPVRLVVETLNGEPALSASVREVFLAAGCVLTPSGLQFSSLRKSASVTGDSQATGRAKGRSFSEAVAQLSPQAEHDVQGNSGSMWRRRLR
ncbi:DEAD/DEAH box helicase [Corynebacterium sp. HS2168-gen11]|nr:DEAD/DEAH box helicase [Corynebacterium sp. HS2168-gen11]MCS4536419.1 DEAD/DEAH box helicase [Corynebacterium sp. HS2168-gen11]